MKATGIVRRIDDLGRVVIPKEIRRAVGIHEGDPIEIFMKGKDTICFRKYRNNLFGQIDDLKDQIKANCDLPYETQEKIALLLEEAQELVKSEV